jgi:hypothetical protein
MPLWALIVLISYAVVAITFFVLIYLEAQNRAVSLNTMHFIVPLFWPIWGIWYLSQVVYEWFRK